VDKYLTLKDMTQSTGCTPRTVRYYERQGLLSAARSAGGHRLFAPQQLERLRYIVALREAGWALEEVEALLTVRDAAGSDRAAAERLDEMLHAQVGKLERKIEVLQRLRADLTGTKKMLAICHVCTEEHEVVDCATCDRLPPQAELPQGFRLSWRGRGAAVPFDEPSADGIDPDDAALGAVEA
jgi:DNA-binding transcriptional MerR regulator